MAKAIDMSQAGDDFDFETQEFDPGHLGFDFSTTNDAHPCGYIAQPNLYCKLP